MYKTWHMSTRINLPQNGVSGSNLTHILSLHHHAKVEVLLLNVQCNLKVAVWMDTKQNVTENTIEQRHSRLKECVLAEGEQYEQQN